MSRLREEIKKLAVRLITETTYYREGDPYDFTALERGVRAMVADEVRKLLEDKVITAADEREGAK